MTKQTEVFKAFGESAYLRPDRTLVIHYMSDGPAPDQPRTVALQRLAVDLRWNARSTYRKRRGMAWFEVGAGVVAIPLPEQADPMLVAIAVLSGRAEWLDHLLVEWTSMLPPIEDYQRGDDVVCRTDDGQVLRVWSNPQRGWVNAERRDLDDGLVVSRWPDVAGLLAACSGGPVGRQAGAV